MNKVLLLYTMTSGLGDYIVMGDLMHKVETLVPGAKCLMAHRGNPHVNLWPYDNPSERFFDVYKPRQLLRLVARLKKARKEGYTVFGLQMAPGSVQGFFFHSCLKRTKALDFIVDFNLINADIIIPPKGNYILDLHLNQAKDLLKVDFPQELYRLNLPIEGLGLPNTSEERIGTFKIGVHPWSRRGHLSSFVWPFERWLELIRFLVLERSGEIVIFGRDEKFREFENYVRVRLNRSLGRINFIECNSVGELVGVVRDLDLIVSVNTAVVHIGYALDKRMVILCGPSLDIWTPKDGEVRVVYDKKADFWGSDKWVDDVRFRRVDRIEVRDVMDAVIELT